MIQIIYLKISFEPNSDVTTKNTNMAKRYKKVALHMFYNYSRFMKVTYCVKCDVITSTSFLTFSIMTKSE